MKKDFVCQENFEKNADLLGYATAGAAPVAEGSADASVRREEVL
jgi:hypothetical protein